MLYASRCRCSDSRMTPSQSHNRASRGPPVAAHLRLDLGDHLPRVLTGRRPAFLGDLAALAEVRENGALAAAGERLAAGTLARPAAPLLALAVVNLVTIFVSLLLAFRHVER